MSVKVLDKSYDLFSKGGYSGTKEQFIELVNSNELALSTSYDLYVSDGEQIDIDEYKKSLTQGEPPIKKKAQPSASQQPSGASNLADGSSASPKPKSVFSQEAIVESITPQETPVPMAPAVTPSQKKAAAEEVKKREVVKPTKYIPDYEKTEEGKIISEEPVVQEEVRVSKEQPGNRLKFFANEFLKGIGSMTAGVSDVVMQGVLSIVEDDPQKREEALKIYREQASPEIREGLKTVVSSPEFLGITEVGKGKEAGYNNEFITSVVASVAQSAPSMISPYGAGMFMQAYDGAIESINNTEEGRNLGETEKTIFASTIGLGIGALEKYSLDKIFGKQSAKVAQGVAIKTMRELVRSSDRPITSEVFEAALDASTRKLRDRLVKGGEKVLEATIVEGVTEGTQEAFTIASEEIVNAASNKQVFDYSDWGDKFGRVMQAAKMGAAAGGLMGGIAAPFQKTRNYIAEKVSEAKTDEDVAKIKEDVVAQAKKAGANEGDVASLITLVDEYSQIVKDVPADAKNKVEAINKLSQKNAIDNTIAEKEAQLSKTDLNARAQSEQEIASLKATSTKLQEQATQLIETGEAKDTDDDIANVVSAMPEKISEAYSSGDFSTLEDETMRVFDDYSPNPNIRNAISNSLKNKVLTGSMTVEKAKETLNNYDMAAGIAQSIPKDIDVAGKKQAMSLLKERNELQQQISGKDEFLVKSQKDRIAEINSELEKIPTTYAIQKQTTDEGVLRQEQPQVELQKVGEGDQVAEVPTQKAEEKIARNLDEGVEQNKGVEISSLKKQINAGLGKDMTLTPEEVSEISKTEFTVLPEEDIDKSDINKPIILIRKRGVPELSVTESLQDAAEDPYTSLSDYFEIVDGRHRIKKAMQSGAGLNAIVITEQEYENATGIEMYSNKEVTGIVNDLGVRNLDEAISELQKKIESGSQRREYNKETGRDAESDLESLIEEKRFRGETKPIKDENIQTKRGEQPEVNVRPESAAAIKQGEPEQAVRNVTKRTEVKESIQKAGKSGVLRSAINKDQPITDEEIDAQMELLDAMSNVWKETTGSDNFYETFVGDVKEGDINAILEKGGALFQDAENPSRPFSRVTLSVFELPEFKKMSGTTVSVNLINDLIKSRGKQIEKDIIASVLNQDKYNGKSKVLFDEFRDDVETQVMKLEKIRTSSYSSYGMDNLGNNQEYGSAETIIFNSPINHGKTGHFSGDFTGRGLDYTTVWEIKQIPGTDQYVAIDSNIPQGTRQDEISSYIGTAGPLEDVKKWIDNRNAPSSEGINKGMFGHIRRWLDKDNGIYNLAELQSDYFQKNKASYDLYAGRIPREEVDEYINKNLMVPLEKKTVELLKDAFKIDLVIDTDLTNDTVVFAVVDENGKTIESKVYNLSSFAPRAGYTIYEQLGHSVMVDAAFNISEEGTDEDKRAFFNIEGEYLNERKRIRSKEESDYIKKRIEEIRKSEEGAGALAQFIASQKFHEVRLFREALKDAAESGAKVLRFPTPYTLAVIEGYVSDTGSAPYEIISGDREFLSPGDQIDYAGDKMTVVESDARNIIVAPAGQVYIVDESQATQDEVDRQMEGALYELKQVVDDIDAITREEAKEIGAKGGYDSRRIAGVMNDYFDNNPDAETLSWDDIEQKFSDRVYDTVSGYGIDELVSWASEVYYNDGTIYAVESRRATETFSQPSEYSSDSNEDNFKDELSDEQETVVKKYEELGAMIKKMRPNAKVVEDGNNKKWIEVEITDSDKSNPIIAFQEEAGKVKGAIDFANDGKASIYMFDGADISTLAHEATGHLGRTVLEALSKVDESFAKDYEYAMKWSGAVDGQWSTRAEEKFARGFERYLIEGKAPSAKLKRVFEKLRTWLLSIYQNIKGSSIDIELTPEIVKVFDNLLSVKQKVSPEVKEGKPEGYDRLMNRVKDVIDRSRRRGQSDEQILDSVIKNVQSRSQEYINATDTQREQIIRDIREMMGKKEKAAPSAKRILGVLENIKKVTMNEMTLIKKAIADMNRGAKTAKAALEAASVQVGKDVSDLVKSGKITTKQAAAIVRRFSSVNMFNQASIEKFVDYVGRIFDNAEYYDNISKASSMIPVAKANLKKLGIAEGLMPSLQRMLAIKPTYIPESVFGKYRLLLDMLSRRDAVLALEDINKVKSDVNEVLDAMNEQESFVFEMKDIFDAYDNKQMDENGELDFSETLKKMVEDETISEADAKLARKYKSVISPTKKIETEEDVATTEQMMEDVKSSSISTDLIDSRLERSLVGRLAKLIKTTAVDTLSKTELNNLLRVIDNINNGYVPHMAQLMVERLEANNDGDILQRALTRAKLLPLSKAYSKAKAAVLRKKDSILTMLERNPWFNVDQLLGDFKTKEVFDAIFQKIASASSRYETEVKNIHERLQKAAKKVLKSFKFNHNKAMMSKFKMMAYMLELEYRSNPGSKQVASAAQFIKKTIEKIESGETQIPEREAKMLQDILDNYSDSNGNIDIDSIYDSFNQAERDAISVIQEINNENTDKAVYTQVVIRGGKIDAIDNYIHHNVISSERPDQDMTGLEGVRNINRQMMPSTRGKSLIEREPGAKAINFDPFQATQRGSDYVLLDFHMTEPIRVMRKAINFAKGKMKKDEAPKEKIKLLNAISKGVEQTIHNTLANHYMSSSIAMDALSYLKKTGYRAILSSAPRFVGELTSNVAYAIFAAPKAFATGISKKVRGIAMSSVGVDVMKNVGSVQVTRIYPSDTLSGRMIDTSIMQDAMGKNSRTKNDIANRMVQINNMTLKPVINAIELTADAIISTPDKLISRPIWFGSFANEFKKLTGNDPDFDLIASNDETYMNENADALAAARRKADIDSIQAGASDNPFVGILKGSISPDQDTIVRGFNMFNNFMTRFLIYEYTTARTAVMAMVGRGTITKSQGGALLAGVTSRMMLYSLLTSTLANGIAGMFVDDEEEDEKTILQKISQSALTALTSMTIGRDFGNATKSILNYGIERINKKYFDFLRDGDYDPYEDQIQYDPFPKAEPGKNVGLKDYIIAMSGAYSPILKTTDLTIRSIASPPKDEQEAQERMDRTLYQRVPLEWAGHLGLVPMYKDVRNILMKHIYKGLKKGEKKSKDDAEKIEKDFLKKFYPDEYEKKYGNESEYYKDRSNINKYGRDVEKRLEGPSNKDVYYGREKPKRKGESSYGRVKPKREEKMYYGRKKE